MIGAMHARRPALLLACAAILAGSGCGDKDPGPPDDRGALLELRVGDSRLAGIPLLAHFAPPSPFVRRPLFLVETPPRVPLILQARIVLEGAADLPGALGRSWPFESGLTLQLPGEPAPLILGWGTLSLESRPPRRGGRPRVRGTLEGLAFTQAGEERPFRIDFEAPVVLLDGRFHAPG